MNHRKSQKNKLQNVKNAQIVKHSEAFSVVISKKAVLLAGPDLGFSRKGGFKKKEKKNFFAAVNFFLKNGSKSANF